MQQLGFNQSKQLYYKNKSTEDIQGFEGAEDGGSEGGL